MQASLRAPIVLLMPRFRINANGVSLKQRRSLWIKIVAKRDPRR